MSGGFKSACEVAIQLGVDYVFSTEDDQAILSDIDLTAFIALLESQPHLAQVALKRTAYSPQEHAAGGIVEAYPHFYTERAADGMTWLETDHLFVFRRRSFHAVSLNARWPTPTHSWKTT